MFKLSTQQQPEMEDLLGENVQKPPKDQASFINIQWSHECRGPAIARVLHIDKILQVVQEACFQNYYADDLKLTQSLSNDNRL